MLNTHLLYNILYSLITNGSVKMPIEVLNEFFDKISNEKKRISFSTCIILLLSIFISFFNKNGVDIFNIYDAVSNHSLDHYINNLNVIQSMMGLFSNYIFIYIIYIYIYFYTNRNKVLFNYDKLLAYANNIFFASSILFIISMWFLICLKGQSFELSSMFDYLSRKNIDLTDISMPFFWTIFGFTFHYLLKYMAKD